jgi:hypothetical protein
MTDEEKIAGMKAMAPHLIGPDKERGFFSWIVFMGYLDYLIENGIITQGQYMMSSKGKDLLSVCDEFEWKPSDFELAAYVNHLFSESEDNKVKIIDMMMNLRDTPNGFRKMVKEIKKESNE